MDYAEARAAFFQPRSAEAPRPGTSTWGSPARALRDAVEPIATICFWSEPAYRAYEAVGLDFLQGYVWARGSVLGEPEGTVVASSFGVVRAGADRLALRLGPRHVQPRGHAQGQGVRRRRPRCARCSARRTAWMRSSRGCTAGRRPRTPPDGPCTPGSPPCRGRTTRSGRLWHACTILREHRGDSHLAACVALRPDRRWRRTCSPSSGSAGTRRPTRRSRGWSPEAMDAGDRGADHARPDRGRRAHR